MKKPLILIIISVLLIATPPIAQDTKLSSEPIAQANQNPAHPIGLASAGGQGNTVDTVAFFSRSFSSMQTKILNTYSNTALHQGQIDLTSYQIPGWQLYSAEIDVSSMTALPEKEVVGVTYQNYNFAVIEILGTFYSQLAQGFYRQPFDGSLQNYSIYYSTTSYNSTLRGNAFFTVNSNYLTSSAITTKTNMTAHDSSFSWATISGQNAALDANQVYWAIINGTSLKKAGTPVPSYPEIYWGSENSAGAFDSYQRGTSSWDLKVLEALFRYTFTPWNRTGGTPLQFFSPESLSLTANSSAQTGLSWTFNSLTSNITRINLNTNQSAIIDYNLVLGYKKLESSTTIWDVLTSGSSVGWNATLDLDYPSVLGITGQYANFTQIPTDWTETGLYLGTSPAGSYSRIGRVVYCSGLSDGTWSLTMTAPNYVTDIALLNHANGSAIGGYVDILVDMDIVASIEDGVSNLITGGVTNLTVLQASSAIYAPIEIPATSGISSFLWNINETTTGNGTHSIEVHWTNGTEAGYFTKQVFVYYPTSLVADDMIISGYTDNSIYVGISFNQLFPARGLDSALANITYSFVTPERVNMNDQTNGRWDKTISTSGLTSGTYDLYIFAEGYALQNRSLTITVNLVVETQPFSPNWSPSNNISYTGYTNLSISYRDKSGTSISGATVNVTFDESTYAMQWNPLSEEYWIQLNGSDFILIPGITTLNVSAWKAGFAPQYNDSIQITVYEETTGVVFSVVWNPSDCNITYAEQITITATFSYNSVPIDNTWDGAWVRATFSGHPGFYANLTYIVGLGKWQITLNGSDYLGTTTITVHANATGYSTNPVTQVLVVTEDTPVLSSSWPSSARTTNYATDAPLDITALDSHGIPINNANLTVTINGTQIHYNSGEYSILVHPPQTRGVYQVNVTMVCYGYVTASIFLNLTVQATTDLSINALSSEFEQWTLEINVTYSDLKYGTPITGASVNVVLHGVTYPLTYSKGVYTTIILLDLDPGNYTINVSATASLADSASASQDLTVNSKRAVTLELVSEGNPIEGQRIVLSATLRYNDTGTVVVGRNVYFIVTIHFVNETVMVLNNNSQSDTTNEKGVATWSFEVPTGDIASIQAQAYFEQCQDLWGAQRTITVTAGINPLMVILRFFLMDTIGRLITFSMVMLGIVVAAYNRRVKPKKRQAIESLESQLQMFTDLESLRHFMAVYLDRGTCVFYHPFTDERIQPDLISGFIAAITSVYGEIKGDGVRGTLEEIQYHGLRLNSYSGEKIIGILILEGEITPLLKDRLQFFVELFENQYEKDLDSWTGLIDCFDTEWIVSTLNSAFNYSWLLPHRFGPTQKVSKTDAKILDYIAAVRDERGEFYLKKLLSPLAEMLGLTEAQILDRLLVLQDRGVIVPVSVQTVLQRQGMGLSEGHDEETHAFIDQAPITEEGEKVEEEPTQEADVEPVEMIDESTSAQEEKAEELVPEPEPEKKEDELEAFVKDVESLLTSEEEPESKEEDEQ